MGQCRKHTSGAENLKPIDRLHSKCLEFRLREISEPLQTQPVQRMFQRGRTPDRERRSRRTHFAFSTSALYGTVHPTTVVIHPLDPCDSAAGAQRYSLECSKAHRQLTPVPTLGDKSLPVRHTE